MFFKYKTKDPEIPLKRTLNPSISFPICTQSRITLESKDSILKTTQLVPMAPSFTVSVKGKIDSVNS
jgi:hypothetical protein